MNLKLAGMKPKSPTIWLSIPVTDISAIRSAAQHVSAIRTPPSSSAISKTNV
jgi:hypothetical protein